MSSSAGKGLPSNSRIGSDRPAAPEAAERLVEDVRVNEVDMVSTRRSRQAARDTEVKPTLSPKFTQDDLSLLDGCGFVGEAPNRERAVGSTHGHVGQHGWISRPRRSLPQVGIRRAPRVT